MELKLDERPYRTLLSKQGVEIFEKILMDPEIHEIYSIGNIMARMEKTTPHDLSHAIRATLICTKLIKLIKETKLKSKLYDFLDEKSMNLAMLIASFMHDIGNYFNREFHSIIASIMAYNILEKYLKDFEKGYLVRSVVCHAISEHSPKKGLPTTLASSIVALSDKLDVSKRRVAGYEPHSFMEYVTDDVLDVSLRKKGEIIFIEIFIDHPSAFYRVEKLQRFLNLFDLINRHFEIVVHENY